MSMSFQDLSQVLAPLKDTFPPQSLITSGNGTGIDVSKVGTNRINFRLSVNDVTVFTSLDVKIQCSPDDSTYTDMVDMQGNVLAFTQVTAANPAPQTITGQLLESLTATANPMKYVRAVATLVGTSVRMSVSVLACLRYDGAAGYQNSPPKTN